MREERSKRAFSTLVRRRPSAGGLGRFPGPWCQLVEPGVGPEVHELGEDVGEVVGDVHIVELAAFDEGGDHRPVLGAFVRGDLMMPGVWGAR